MTALVLLLPDAEATHRLGVELGKSLPPSTTLLLEGDLGAGKTSLVQGIGEGLGVGDRIVSPTFTLINEYDDGRIPLYHLDLYRLDTTEVAGLMPEIYWEGEEVEPGIMAIEWADRLSYLPSEYVRLRLRHDSDRRQVEVSSTGEIPLVFREFAGESAR